MTRRARLSLRPVRVGARRRAARRRARALPPLRPHRHAVVDASSTPTRARRSSSTCRGCSSTSCTALGLDGRRAHRARLRLRDAARRRRRDSPTVGLLAHVDTSPDAPGAGVEPQVHGALRRRRARAARRPAQCSARDEPAARRADRPRHRHLRRDDPARRRRQGRRRGDHGRGRLARSPTPTCRAPARGSRSPSTRRSAAASTTSTSSASAPTSPTRSTARSVGEIENETFSAIELEGDLPRRRRPPRHGEGPARQPGQARRAVRREPAARTRSRRRRPRGARASSTRTRSRAAPSGVTVTLILRDYDGAKLARARGARPPARRGGRCGRPARERHLRALGAVPQHARGARPRPARRRGGARGDAARRARADARTRSAAAPTASRLTEMGLPTPNVFAGGNDFHSVREWISVAGHGDLRRHGRRAAEASGPSRAAGSSPSPGGAGDAPAAAAVASAGDEVAGGGGRDRRRRRRLLDPLLADEARPPRRRPRRARRPDERVDVPLGRAGRTASGIADPDEDDDALGRALPDARRGGRARDRLARGRIAQARLFARAAGGARTPVRVGENVRPAAGADLPVGGAAAVPPDVDGRRPRRRLPADRRLHRPVAAHHSRSPKVRAGAAPRS